MTYFLLNEYLEIINDEELDVSHNFAPKIKENNFFKNSVFGQIGSFIITVMESYFEFLKKYKVKLQNYWREKNLQKLNTNSYNETISLELQKQFTKESSRFFGKNSAHIEILRNDEVEKVYFILNPFCQFLPIVKLLVIKSKSNYFF